jgi:membrane protein
VSSEIADRRDAPPPDDVSKPDSPTKLTKRSWMYVARKSVREFSKDECTDLAAGLTYYAVLAVFPAGIALVSVLGVIGQGPSAVDNLLDILRQAGASSAVDTFGPTLRDVSSSQAAGPALVIGLAVALWSASAYVGAFGRALNRVYEVAEGRPVWKLRPMQLLVTLVLVVLVALTAAGLVVSGPLARAVGDKIGLGSAAVTAWDIAKWPVLLLIVIVTVAILYYATPNVRQPKFRWLSVGAAIAIAIWIAASAAFGFYVANFSSYDKTYGSLAGVVVFLLWLWLTNLALLFGAEVDAELERGRELQAGLPAEEAIQLPVRDSRKIDKAEEKRAEDVRRAREIRERAAAGSPESGDDQHDSPSPDKTTVG